MRYSLGLAATSLLASCSVMVDPAPKGPTISAEDLAMLEGDWTGALTYRDYTEPYEDVSIPAALTVTPRDEGILLQLSYSDEPSAYDASMLSVSENGRRLNSEDVVSRTDFEGETLLITESACEDDGRPARCEMRYTLSPQVFEMTKMVTLDSGGEPFRRNTYAFERAGDPD